MQIGRLLRWPRRSAARNSDDVLVRHATDEIAVRGFTALRQVLARDDVGAICVAAQAFYDDVERRRLEPATAYPRSYLFNAGNMATSMAALDDYGTADYQLLRIVANSWAAACLRHYLGDDLVCSLTHSRMRKSYPQSIPDHPRPSTVAWHSDGDKNVGYYGAYVLWVPFTPCNLDFAGLEFEQADGTIAKVDLELGDALLFPATTMHRTADCPTSTQVRYSCDMRFFKVGDIPGRVHVKIAQDSLLSVRAFASEPW